jgi:CheY-like chemotaxis protein
VVAVADRALRECVATTLADEGYAVERAETAPAALAALARPGAPRPALLLLDHRLAALDGVPFAAWYRRQPGPHAPLLLLGAPAGPAPTAAGAAGAVGQPVDVDAFLATVARLTRLAVLAADRPEATDLRHRRTGRRP